MASICTATHHTHHQSSSSSAGRTRLRSVRRSTGYAPWTCPWSEGIARLAPAARAHALPTAPSCVTQPRMRISTRKCQAMGSANNMRRTVGQLRRRTMCAQVRHPVPSSCAGGAASSRAACFPTAPGCSTCLHARAHQRQGNRAHVRSQSGGGVLHRHTTHFSWGNVHVL